MAVEFGTFTDPRDGEVYKTIKVDGQEWLAENFRFKCRNSSSLDNDEANDKKYGRFYSGRIASMVAPDGWHLPTYDEFLKLAEALGSKKQVDLASTEGWEELNGTNSTGFNAQPLGYCEPDTSGSSDRVTRVKSDLGKFHEKGQYAAFWTSDLNEPTPNNHSEFCTFNITTDKDNPDEEIYPKEDCNASFITTRFTLRLVRNAETYEPQFGTFTDERDGKTYKTVIIGKQEWFAENLSFNAEGSKVYEDNAENEKKYGRLYDLEAGLKAIPEGWKMPDRKDVKTLVDFIAATANTTKYQVAPFLKSKEDWNIDGFFEGSDAVGFNALAAGIGEAYKDGTYKFSGLGTEAYFRTATSEKVNRLWEREMDFKEPTGFGDYDLMSVRPFRPYKALAGTKKTTAKAKTDDAKPAKKTTTKAKAAKGNAPVEGTFVDSRDGETYKTITIGDQVWMAQNLRFKCEGAMPSPEHETDVATYGYLYNHNTAVTIIPKGWHLPSLAEVEILRTAVKKISKCKKDCEGDVLKSKDWKTGELDIGFNAPKTGFLLSTYDRERNKILKPITHTSGFWLSDTSDRGTSENFLTFELQEDNNKLIATNLCIGAYPLNCYSLRLIKDK